MKRIATADVEAVGRFVSESPAKAISIGELRQHLGVDYGTARRRLEAFAKVKGFVLEAERGRVGTRGPESWRWFLRRVGDGVDRSRVRTEKVRAVARRGGPAGRVPTRRTEPVVTRRVRAVGQVLDPAEDVAPEIPPVVLRALKGDELLALRLLAKTGAVRTTALAEHIGHSPGRVGGMMRALRRKLHGLGFELFSDESLGDGEVMFRWNRRGTR